MCTGTRLHRLHGMPLRPSVFLALTALQLGACARTTWVNELDVPGLCPPDARRYAPAPILRWVAVDAAATDDAIPSLRVRVVARDDERTLAGAAVLVESSPRVGRMSDSAGVARFDTTIAPGRYALLTRRIGFHPRRDSVTLPGAPGTMLEVPLEPALTDGPCSGLVAVRVRRPWWHWW
jgi:hypothetical protein